MICQRERASARGAEQGACCGAAQHRAEVQKVPQGQGDPAGGILASGLASRRRASERRLRAGRPRAGAAMTARATHLCERRRHGGGGAESSPHFEAESASRHVAVLPL